MRRVMSASGMNLMITKIKAALKSSLVFILYLEIVGNIVIIMSHAKTVNAMTPILYMK